MLEFSTEYSIIGIIVAAFVSSLLSFFLYYNSKYGKGLKLTLGILRFLSLFIIAILLIGPFLKKTEEIEKKPIVLHLIDQSYSTDSFARFDLDTELLSDKYEVQQKYFASELQFTSSDSLQKGLTNIGGSLNKIREIYDSRPLAAIILETDGLNNIGSDPSLNNSNSAVPVYTIGIGDSSSTSDLYIESVQLNKTTYPANEFPVKVKIKGVNLSSNSFSLKIYDSDYKVLVNKTYSFQDANPYINETFYLREDSSGIKSYQLVLSELEEELVYSNNEAKFSISVEERTKKIVLVYKSLNPDIGAIRSAMKDLRAYNLELLSVDDFQYDEEVLAYILYEVSLGVFESVNKSKKPYWLFYGPNSSFQNQRKFGYKFIKEKYEQAQVYVNPDFQLFEIDPDFLDLAKDLPPVSLPFGDISSRESSKHLLFKSLNGIETQNPVWSYDIENNRKSIKSLVSNFWKWRFYLYRKTDSHEVFNSFINKNLQYLSASEKSNDLVVDVEPIQSLNSPISFKASFLDESLELNNTADCQLVLIDSSGKEFEQVFSRGLKDYKASLQIQNPGVYKWRASLEYQGQKIERNGNLLIEDSQIEYSNKSSDFKMLRSLSHISDGKFYTLENSQSIYKDLNENLEVSSRIEFIEKVDNILSQKWLYIVLLLLLAVEWVLRKLFGNN